MSKVDKVVVGGHKVKVPIPPDMVQNYISSMLKELAIMANESGLENLYSLLRVTETAARVNAKNLD